MSTSIGTPRSSIVTVSLYKGVVIDEFPEDCTLYIKTILERAEFSCSSLVQVPDVGVADTW